VLPLSLSWGNDPDRIGNRDIGIVSSNCMAWDDLLKGPQISNDQLIAAMHHQNKGRAADFSG